MSYIVNLNSPHFFLPTNDINLVLKSSKSDSPFFNSLQIFLLFRFYVYVSLYRYLTENVRSRSPYVRVNID